MVENPLCECRAKYGESFRNSIEIAYETHYSEFSPDFRLGITAKRNA